MRILLSNDDGYQAPGLEVLANAMCEFGESDVVAPDRDCSGASHSLTLDRPLRVNQDRRGFYYVNGTPTDCVHLAITGLLDYDPDLVISGINAGANMGDDVLYSGTVAAAIEARFLGRPALALSLAATEDPPEHYDDAVSVVSSLIRHLLMYWPKEPWLLNINIPDVRKEEIDGFEVTRLGNRHRAEPVERVYDPKGRLTYWVGAAGSEQDAGVGTDFYAVNHNRVSITPLQIDFTAHARLQALKDVLQGMALDR